MRRMVLQARAAAARFCSRKTHVSRWIPALMRWAHCKRARRDTPLHSSTHWHSHSFRGSWATHLNLHFHVAARFHASHSHASLSATGVPTPGNASISRSAALLGSPAFLRLASARVPLSQASASGSTESVREHVRKFSRIHASWRRLRTTASTDAARGERSRPFVAVASAMPGRSRMHRAGTAGGAVGAGSRVPPQRILRAARATARSPAGEKKSTRPLPTWATRSPDLVWRATSGISESRPRVADARRSTLTTAMPTSNASPPAASLASAQNLVRAAALEPGLAERLADDVIRRIDRRARIERERNGN
jgi:hypothetical protein